MCVSLIGGLIFSSNPPDTAIFNWVSKIIWDSVFFLYFALWLVQKTRASLLTDQMPTKSNHNLVPRVFPLRSQFGRFFFELLLSLKGFFFPPDGRYDYFGFGFTTLFLRKVLYIANWYLSTGYSDPCYEEIVQQNTSFTCKGNAYFADILSQEDMSVVVPHQRATSFELVPGEGNNNHVGDQLQKFDESYIPSIERPLARRYSFGKEKQKLPHDDKSRS